MAEGLGIDDLNVLSNWNPSMILWSAHPLGCTSQAESLHTLKSLSNNLNKVNPSRGARGNHTKRLSFPPAVHLSVSTRREGGKLLCCPWGEMGPDGCGITSVTARGELGAPCWQFCLQVWGGTPHCSCFDSVLGPHPALLHRGLRHALLFVLVVLRAAEDANPVLLKKWLHLGLEGGIESGYPLICNSFFLFLNF